MGTGIRAEISVEAADVCPVAAAAEATGTSSDAVSRSVNPKSGDTITEEFTWETESGGEYTARGTLTADREMTAETTVSV